MTMQQLYLLVPLAPLAAAALVGLYGPRLGRSLSHWLCILGVAAAFVGSLVVWQDARAGNVFNGDVYTWLQSGDLRLAIGFLIDPLTATMMVVVTFVSLMVHVYTVGYMADDPGYTRFFSYISLFTFSMLMLVMSNNFVQLFFGWEAVGLVCHTCSSASGTRGRPRFTPTSRRFWSTASVTLASCSESASSSPTSARWTTPRCSPAPTSSRTPGSPRGVKPSGP
jgi:NADH:ubiquinone oxidoreductase subunit 2 (subunit N)